ncbi:MAG: Crp/Fnr family transcriptional regulator [Alphaproteobacteria bacterium]|nr:Crp/Fnr family transcriptional regulator [Alphaproteobacteria bacterium]
MDDIINTLSEAPLFATLTPSVLNDISKNAHPNAHKKGKILFIHGDPAEHYYIVKSGHIKLFRETVDGTQTIIDVLSQGNVFGHTLVFEENTYPYSAEIAESGIIISLPLSDLRDALYNDNTIAINMLRATTNRLRLREKELEHRSTQNASQRIACFFLRHTLQRKNDSLVIHLPYDKMLLAAHLGMQPETFSRALLKLKKDTGIRIEGSSIYLNTLDRLSSYVCSSCSERFPCNG